MREKIVQVTLSFALIAVTAVFSLSVISAADEIKGYFDKPTAEIVKGDVNSDGVTDRNDYNEIQKVLIDRDYSADLTDAEYDVNGDGTTDARDFLLLKQQYSYEYDVRMKKEADEAGIEYQREDGRILVWHDEFDGDDLDYDKWTWRGTMGSGRTQYVCDETTFDVTDGNIHMIASTTGDENQPYKNCLGLTTYDKMFYKYGYAEVKAILSTKTGTWQSWWLMGNITRSKSFWHAEIDIFESSATEGAVALHKHHNDYVTNSHQLPSIHNWANRYYIDENEYYDYHIYSFDWSENHMIFAVDGEVYGDFDMESGLGWDENKSKATSDAGGMGLNTPIPGTDGFNDYVYMIFNNEFVNLGNGGNSEFGNCVTVDDMPIEYYIDYVRLWQNPETDGICICEDIKEHEYKNGTALRTKAPPQA